MACAPAEAWARAVDTVRRSPPPRSIALAGALLMVGKAQAGTVWLCGLSDDLVRLVCMADDDTLPDTGRPAAANTAQVTVTADALWPARSA